jgi:hypothetical protein
MLHLSMCSMGLSNVRRLIEASPSLRSFQCSDPHERSEHLLDTLAAHCPLLQVLSYEILAHDTSSLVQLLQACQHVEVVEFLADSGVPDPGIIDLHAAVVMQHCKKLKALNLSAGFAASTMVCGRVCQEAAASLLV